jgi:hypothetical protein
VCVRQGEVDAVFVNAILSGIQLRNMEVCFVCVISIEETSILVLQCVRVVKIVIKSIKITKTYLKLKATLIDQFGIQTHLLLVSLVFESSFRYWFDL